ncbi:MAG: hypothetical protein IT373_15490 [Polyangiaceae bacterium]|nr:hypothetical protein [Polyangiaceae bacterium]
MIRINIEIDGRLAKFVQFTRRTLMNRKALAVMAAVAVTIPVVAIASPLTTPNTFTAGTVISAAAVNANFDAIEAAVDDNDARITLLEGAPKLATCTWRVVTSNATLVTADCTGGKYAASGGCFSNPGVRSSGPTGNPADGALATSATGWACALAAADAANRAFALCCTP